MRKTYKVVTINPTTSPSQYHNNTKELENLLNEGWIIERETVISCSVSSPDYRGLSSVIYILSIDKV